MATKSKWARHNHVNNKGPRSDTAVTTAREQVDAQLHKANFFQANESQLREYWKLENNIDELESRKRKKSVVTFADLEGTFP